MKYKIELLIVASVLFCLSFVQVAGASYTAKSLYIDGQHVVDANGDDALSFTAGVIRLGAEGSDDYIYNEYIGKMDEFAVYAGLLSPERIKAHYDANDSNSAYTAAVQLDNPVLWLRFQDADAASGSTAENSGSSSTDGRYFILGGVSAMSLVQGINADSNALYIPDSGDAEAGHKVEVSDNGEFGGDLLDAKGNGQITVEIWLNFTDIASMSGNDYARFYTTAGVSGYGLHIDSGDPNQWIIHGGGENYVTVSPDLNDGQWHQVVITYDSNYTAPNLPPAGEYVAEVNKDNPILWLRFEDSQPKDYAADANHWVGYGSAASIVEKAGGIGKSVLLNGTGGNGVYGVAAKNDSNAPPMDPNATIGYEIFGDQYAFAPNDITFELWYKSLPAGEPQPESFGLLFQQIGTHNNEPCGPAVSNSGGQIRVFGGTGAWYTGIDPKFDQQWHQLVVTYDEEYGGDPCSMRAQVYLDGVERGNNTFTGARAKLGPELSHILIGAENDIGNTYNLIPGYFDEFAIYEGILDPNRVMAHYSAWQPKNCEDLLNRNPAVAGDMDRNCKVNFKDFALLALDWATYADPNDPNTWNNIN